MDVPRLPLLSKTCLAGVEGGVDGEVDGVLGLARVVVVDEGRVRGDLVARREPSHQLLALVHLEFNVEGFPDKFSVLTFTVFV